MEIYILRHGAAEDRRPGHSDADRRLTVEGRDKLRRVLEVARASGVVPPVVLSSPYVRAFETAEIAAEVLKSPRPVVTSKALVPSSSPEAVWQLIRDYSGEAAVLLAGHEPLLGETVSYLLGASRVVTDLKKGALARIDVAAFGIEPRGTLQWLLTAKLAAARMVPTGE